MTSRRAAKKPRLTWPDVTARRLRRQGLAEPFVDASPADVVAAMCGAHAQVLSAAELSIGVRLAGATRADVRHALWSERSLVKTFGPRGTVHLLPTRDLAMWTGALSAVPAATNGMPPEIRLTPEQTDEVVTAIGHALADAELTVDELTEAIVEATGAWAGELVMPAFQVMWPRWRQVMATAAHRGALAFGANRGRKVTYTNPHRWSPGLVPADGAAASDDLLRRYLHAYGPATPAHYAKWLAAPLSWAGERFDAIRDDLQEVDLDGTTAWANAGDVGDVGAGNESPSGVRLLPYFDAYAVAAQPRAWVFPGRASERALAGGQAGNFPVLLVDGVAAGVWHQRRSGRRIDVTVEPLEPLTAGQRDLLTDQVDRMAEILEGRPSLTIGPVAIGPHA